MGCTTSPSKSLSTPDALKAAEINAQIAVHHLESGDLALAKEKVDKALQQNPQAVNAHLVAAEVEARLNNGDAERWHYEQALAQDPSHSSVLNNYAGYLCRQSQVDEAIDIFERVVADRLYPQPALVLSNAGRCLFEADQWAQARGYWQRAIAEQTNYPPALFGLAEVELAFGELNAAQSYFSRYTALKRESPQQLLLGYRIAKASGDVQGRARYRSRLENDFPSSKQAIDINAW